MRLRHTNGTASPPRTKLEKSRFLVKLLADPDRVWPDDVGYEKGRANLHPTSEAFLGDGTQVLLILLAAATSVCMCWGW